MNVFRLKSSANSNKTNGTQSKASSISESVPVTHEPLLSPPADYSPSLQPALDESQQDKLEKLRTYIQSIMLPEDHEYYASEKGFVTDGTLKRYLRARKWEYEASKTMLENTVRWRRDYRPDELDPDYIKPEAETGKMYFDGFDNAGRPIWIMRPRQQNSKDADRQVKHIVFCLERGIRLMPAKVENIAIIVDFKDSAYAHNPSIATCKKFLDILSNHYPERLGIAFVVKSPWFFFTTFKMISPFMDPVTKAKIKFVHDEDKKGGKEDTKGMSNEWVNLKDYVPKDMLECEYGGTYNFSYDVDSYWNALLEHTGKPYKVIDYM
ncbi:CRAL-TRIO domain-containing protein [Zychaea mexicana]|uniref:CRAL-TRIO domain-containing protein n=1 Tax=Zychaea mexicana TaxID=64656 RepID=UPI0022FEEA54|nr:CRAL-TRIO domain-containing protein [Zychaea mexicana]KAI9490779.1 CRAL-TRIO domain-containing protein [Zychaea mexicana]